MFNQLLSSFGTEIFKTLQAADWKIILVASFGGIILAVYKAIEHSRRDECEKHKGLYYGLWLLAVFFALPILGGMMVVVYLANGDKISPLLSLQVGLTSPAIVEGIIAAAANKGAKNPVRTPKDA